MGTCLLLEGNNCLSQQQTDAQRGAHMPCGNAAAAMRVQARLAMIDTLAPGRTLK